MTDIYPPFTPDYRFTGPNTAISCEADYDEEEAEYIAKSGNGFRGTGETADAAALNCFKAWMTRERGWFNKDTR